MKLDDHRARLHGAAFLLIAACPHLVGGVFAEHGHHVDLVTAGKEVEKETRAVFGAAPPDPPRTTNEHGFSRTVPLPGNVETVKHDKSAGSGYGIGSPLYPKQAERNQHRPASTSPKDFDVQVARNQVQSERDSLLPSWVGVPAWQEGRTSSVLVAIVGLLALIACVFFSTLTPDDPKEDEFRPPLPVYPLTPLSQRNWPLMLPAMKLPWKSSHPLQSDEEPEPQQADVRVQRSTAPPDFRSAPCVSSASFSASGFSRQMGAGPLGHSMTWHGKAGSFRTGSSLPGPVSSTQTWPPTVPPLVLSSSPTAIRGTKRETFFPSEAPRHPEDSSSESGMVCLTSTLMK